MTTKQVTITLTVNEAQNTFDDQDIATVVNKIFDCGIEDIGSTGNIVQDTIIDNIINLMSIDVNTVPREEPQGLEEILQYGLQTGSVKVGI